MTRTERKLLLINGVLGTALTLIVLILDQTDQLQTLERWFYDRRALHCQFFIKPPTDRIVYLDIDDNAIETIGRWPWDRRKMAGIIDEVAAAGPQLIFLDILYTEPQSAYGELQPDGKWVTVEQDPALAAALHRAGNVLVPISLDFSIGMMSLTAADQRIKEMLRGDLELTAAEVSDRLAAQGLQRPEPDFNSRFIVARRAAMYERIDRELAKSPDIDPAQLRPLLLPQTNPRLVASPLLRLLAQEFEKLERLRPLQRFSRPLHESDPPLLSADDEAAPLEVFSREGGGSGFINYIPDPDGVIRRIPLLAQHRGRVVPQVGLVIACRLMGIDPTKVQASPSQVILPRPGGGEIRIPTATRTQVATGREIGAIMDIPYFGGRDWETMFDLNRKQAKQHIPIKIVWQVTQTRDAIAFNNATADRGLLEALKDTLGEDKLKEYADKKLAPDDAATRLAWMREVLEVVGKFLDQYKNDPKLTEADLKPITRLKNVAGLPWMRPVFDAWDQILEPLKLTEEDAKQIADLKNHQEGMRQLIAENQRLGTQLIGQRAEIKNLLGGRAVLVGSIGTGTADDVKPTALHGKCPGVVIHGVIANGILTGELWREAPLWIRHVLTLLMGLATTVLVMRMTPQKAAIATVALAGCYLLINGILLFDYFNIILGVAGPIVAMLITWLSCQLVEILVEKAERRRITKRFRSYVDPALVKYVIEHPEQDVMSGHEREMTVVFTDLAGFTTISEALKEKVVPLLNEYLGMMVTIIRRHQGYVNKFLGDGIMFFYNAPWDNPNHAVDAISTVMDMQDAMLRFNESLKKRGLPALTMRAGITTGPMVVGDAGSKDGSDYTVIGDNVNLAARLESANKATDTKVMMTARTCELLGGRFLVRPTARLQVKGKTEGDDTCELIARTDQATDQQRRQAELGKAVFDAFVKSDFAACLKAVELIEAEFGKTKLTKAYHELSEQYLKEPPGDGFDGQIVLHEK